MAPDFPACPHLPPLKQGLNWTTLNSFEKEDRGAAFYRACLDYAQSLWVRGFAARSILCVDRAMGADVRAEEPALREWPMPYAALVWILRSVPEGVFIGNPRVHFQHYADRLTAPRRDQRRWRAWACWALARAVMPDLPGDPRHPVDEPSEALIFACLTEHGLAGEATLWRDILAGSGPR